MTELRTLKDFEVNPTSFAGAMANAGRKYTIIIDDLKREAIKIVKDKKEQLINIKEELDKARNGIIQEQRIRFPHLNDMEYLTKDEKLILFKKLKDNSSIWLSKTNLESDRDIIFGQILAYEYFFNITEEDLK